MSPIYVSSFFAPTNLF